MRVAAGYSQEALAAASDVHLTQIGGMERGVRNPSYTTLLRVASALNSQVGELTTLADRIRSEMGNSHAGSAHLRGPLEDSSSASVRNDPPHRHRVAGRKRHPSSVEEHHT